MRHSWIGAVLVAALAALSSVTASAQVPKTAAQCSADYAANKPALKAAKIKKGDFIASCRAGNEVIPTAAAGAAGYRVRFSHRVYYSTTF